MCNEMKRKRFTKDFFPIKCNSGVVAVVWALVRRRGVRGKGAALRSHRQSATSVRNPLRTQDSAALVRIYPAVWSWANHLMDSSPFSGTWWTAKLQTTSLQTENFKLPTSVTGPVSSPRLYKYAKLSGLSLSQGFLSPRIKIHQSINQF